MASYKVPQDVEAEDKFLGPLTFKQFLFGSGTLVTGYMIFIFATKGWWVLVISILPFFLICTAFAFPWSKDQPTDLWLAARIRFILVPRKRIWDQSGVKDLVQITVPRKQVRIYSDGLSQDQVRSRMTALASVADSRGWAVKNMSPSVAVAQTSDRLVMPGVSTPPTENEIILNNTVDVMDGKSSPLIQQFDALIKDSSTKHRQETMQKLEQARQTYSQNWTANPATVPVGQQPQSLSQLPVASQDAPDDYWYLHELPELASPNLEAIKQDLPTITPRNNTHHKEQAQGATHHTKKHHIATKKRDHIRVIDPLKRDEHGMIVDEKTASGAAIPPELISTTQPQNTSTSQVNPAILTLADNDDLDIATIARQAKKDRLDDGEIIVPLR